jgi:hypothetical protein
MVYETAAKHIIQVFLNSGSTWKTLDMTQMVISTRRNGIRTTAPHT